MSDINLLISLAVLVVGALGAGAWLLFATRRTAVDGQAGSDNAAGGLADEIDAIKRQVDLMSGVLEHSGRVRIVVRNTTTGQYRGAVRRTARNLASRIPAE